MTELYRLRLDLAFEDEADCNDVLDKALDKLEESVYINPGSEDQESKWVIKELCRHDRPSGGECEELGHWPLD